MQLSKEIIEILEYLCQKIGITIDWSSEHILPYVKQLCEKLITWEISTSIAWITIMWGLTIVALIFAIVIAHFDIHDEWCGFEWIIFGFVVVGTLIVTGVQIFDIIECKTIPEKVIYDYITNYLSQS